MAGIALSTAGVSLNYAVETEVGKRPTAGYARINDIKGIPSFNPAPETIESTTLENTEYKSYVEALKDPGGALEFTANFTEALQTQWDVIVTAYNEAIAAGKQMWFQIKHPKLPKAVFFTGTPSKMGMPAAEINSIYETSVFITPTNEPDWFEKTADEAAAE